MGRRYDPERRQRIIDAAIRIVERKGIAGLSHRSVASEADVPLGSTTYHFAGLDELLVAALEQLVCEPQSALKDWHVDHGGAAAGEGFLDVLTRVLEEYASGGRGRIRLEYELYLEALRRPALEPVAAAWLDDMTRQLHRYTGDLGTARALTAVIDGLLLQYLLTDRSFDRDEVRGALARVVEGPEQAVQRR